MRSFIMRSMVCLALVAGHSVTAINTTLLETMAAEIQELKRTTAAEIQELKGTVGHLEKAMAEQELPGQILMFGLDECPPLYEQLNDTKGEMLMSKPDGAHALAKRVLASSRFA
jgi:hypothetical protein